VRPLGCVFLSRAASGLRMVAWQPKGLNRCSGGVLVGNRIEKGERPPRDSWGRMLRRCALRELLNSSNIGPRPERSISWRTPHPSTQPPFSANPFWNWHSAIEERWRMPCQKLVQRVTFIFACVIAVDDFHLLTNAIVLEVWMESCCVNAFIFLWLQLVHKRPYRERSCVTVNQELLQGFW